MTAAATATTGGAFTATATALYMKGLESQNMKKLNKPSIYHPGAVIVSYVLL